VFLGACASPNPAHTTFSAEKNNEKGQESQDQSKKLCGQLVTALAYNIIPTLRLQSSETTEGVFTLQVIIL
jgi:hypothetical protein